MKYFRRLWLRFFAKLRYPRFTCLIKQHGTMPNQWRILVYDRHRLYVDFRVDGTYDSAFESAYTGVWR
jgi:hypothetical protein